MTRRSVCCFVAAAIAWSTASLHAEVAEPVLKWQHGGCFASWCETGWYASPAVADVDGDDAPEIIASTYSIVVLDGATGSLEWRVASGHDRSQPTAENVGRTWPGLVVADVDGDDADEIVSAHGNGWVAVYTGAGYFEPGWPQHPTTSELRGLSVADLDNDRSMEILVTAAIGSPVNAWIFEHDGSLRGGWPQLSDSGGYAWGVFNDTSALADLTGDGRADVIIPSDVHYICAYEADGSHIPADPVFGDKNWGQVGVWESYATELRGWGACDGDRAESYRTNFADGAAAVADLDGNGSLEVAISGRTYECGDPSGEITHYTGINIFAADRGRFQSGAYDWTTVPVDLGAPISVSWEEIESVMPNPTTVDLDGDGELEIVFPDFSGKLHAFWLDGTEHGSWPYQVYSSGAYRFASETAVADLDNDGAAEVIFTTWTAKGSYETGDLIILDSSGNLLHQVPLPVAFGGPDWNGALPCPTLANVDGDSDLEVVVQSAHSGVVVYDLPGTANARVLWGTGRGSFLRNGAAPIPGLIFGDGFERGSTAAWSQATP